jgi:hypothetical protein
VRRGRRDVVAVAVVEHAPEHRDAERAADLAGEVVHGRGDPLPLGREGRNDRRRRGRRREPDPDAGHERGQAEGRVARPGPERGEDQEPGADHGQAGAADRPHAQAGRDPRRLVARSARA